jgi:hypothetical protein
MEKVEQFYRTQDGQEDYCFSFEQQENGDWKIYILKQPSYKTSPMDLHSTHRQYDCKGKFIAWTPPPDSFEEAQNIAALWAEFTLEHIRKGNRNEKNHHSRIDIQINPDSEDDDDGSFEHY